MSSLIHFVAAIPRNAFGLVSAVAQIVSTSTRASVRAFVLTWRLERDVRSLIVFALAIMAYGVACYIVGKEDNCKVLMFS